MFIAAETVSVGGLTPGGVAIAKSTPQGLPSPAEPPDEFTHLSRMSARLSSLEFSEK
jgi:hypothetical protein